MVFKGSFWIFLVLPVAFELLLFFDWFKFSSVWSLWKFSKLLKLNRLLENSCALLVPVSENKFWLNSRITGLAGSGIALFSFVAVCISLSSTNYVSVNQFFKLGRKR